MPVVKLSRRNIPRDDKGDPSFTMLDCGSPNSERSGEGKCDALRPPCVRHVFTSEEVTAMVNRYLYQAFYQLDSHKKRAKAEAERMSPLKKMVRQMFGVSFINATDQQLKAAQKRLEDQATGK